MEYFTFIISSLADLIISLTTSIKSFFIIPDTNTLNFFGIILLPIIVITIIDYSLSLLFSTFGGSDNEEN